MPQPEVFDLTLRSGVLHAQRWGSAGAPLTLCVHGLSANLHAFDYLAERLAGPDRQLVAFDLRGRAAARPPPRAAMGCRHMPTTCWRRPRRLVPIVLTSSAGLSAP